MEEAVKRLEHWKHVAENAHKATVAAGSAEVSARALRWVDENGELFTHEDVSDLVAEIGLTVQWCAQMVLEIEEAGFVVDHDEVGLPRNASPFPPQGGSRMDGPMFRDRSGR